MPAPRFLLATALAADLAIFAACSDPLEVDLLAVDVIGVPRVSPTSPGEFVVTVSNRGSRRIVWGMGSSSCQLTLVVRVDNREESADQRACTDDLVEQGLNPGETRTEAFVWGGEIQGPSGPVTLAPGRYELRGKAGDEGRSRFLPVDVEPALLPGR